MDIVEEELQTRMIAAGFGRLSVVGRDCCGIACVFAERFFRRLVRAGLQASVWRETERKAKGCYV